MKWIYTSLKLVYQFKANNIWHTIIANLLNYVAKVIIVVLHKKHLKTEILAAILSILNLNDNVNECLLYSHASVSGTYVQYSYFNMPATRHTHKNSNTLQCPFGN